MSDAKDQSFPSLTSTPSVAEDWTIISDAPTPITRTVNEEGWEAVETSKPAYADIASRSLTSSPVPPTPSNVCPKCSFINHPDMLTCEMCEQSLKGPKTVNLPTALKAPISDVELPQKKCPQCTFLNHPSLEKCEMCDTDLEVKVSKSSTLSDEELDEADFSFSGKQAKKAYGDFVLRQ